MTTRLIIGDCLDRMRELPDTSVDAIVMDLPYGSTKCDWDTRIDLARFWTEAKRLITPGSPVVMFADMRYAVELINSNPKWFRYDLVWDKVVPVGFLNAARQPLRSHELILVFAPKGPRYRPQKWVSQNRWTFKCDKHASKIYGKHVKTGRIATDDSRFPTSIVKTARTERGANGYLLKNFHPTQKPVGLLTYLIKTFTDEGMTVLDPTMGSGSTGMACLETGRAFIGIEKDPEIFATAKKRIKTAVAV